MTQTQTKQDYFFCYSKSLRNHLVDNDFRYITTAKSISSDDQFWLFYRDDELNKAIVEFSEERVK